MNPLPFDEINQFREKLPAHFENGIIRSEQDKEDIIDELLDLFLLAYARGMESVKADLEISDDDYRPGIKKVLDTVDREIAGKTWRDRVNEYFDNGGTEADIMRIAETEAHRDSNEAAYVTATDNKATKKTWHCLMLPTSREQHQFLNGVQVPIDAYFYTYTGAAAQFPGEFGEADNDVNCLCWVTYEK